MTRRKSKLPRRTQLRLIEHFVAGTPARTAADLVSVNRNTATLYYHKLRETICEHVAHESPFGGEVELDESYFGGHRKGKRGRGAAGKVVVFGILKRGGRVYTALPANLKRATLLPIIHSQVEPDSVVFTDGFRAYDTLNASGFEHYRVNHAEELVSASGAHINGIENFWSQSKRHLRRYNGIPKAHFELFIKECEWRFNYGGPRKLVSTLTAWHLI